MAVLSGNRNFEGRIRPLTQANYLASPPLVIVFAIAGTVHYYYLSKVAPYNGQHQELMMTAF